jgi:hypothetical protein
MKPIDKAARIVAAEATLLLGPASSGPVIRRILEKLPTFLDPDERKAAVLLGLRIAHRGVQELWPDEDREAAGARTGTSF